MCRYSGLLKNMKILASYIYVYIYIYCVVIDCNIDWVIYGDLNIDIYCVIWTLERI